MSVYVLACFSRPDALGVSSAPFVTILVCCQHVCTVAAALLLCSHMVTSRLQQLLHNGCCDGAWLAAEGVYAGGRQDGGLVPGVAGWLPGSCPGPGSCAGSRHAGSGGGHALLAQSAWPAAPPPAQPGHGELLSSSPTLQTCAIMAQAAHQLKCFLPLQSLTQGKRLALCCSRKSVFIMRLPAGCCGSRGRGSRQAQLAEHLCSPGAAGEDHDTRPLCGRQYCCQRVPSWPCTIIMGLMIVPMTDRKLLCWRCGDGSVSCSCAGVRGRWCRGRGQG